MLYKLKGLWVLGVLGASSGAFQTADAQVPVITGVTSPATQLSLTSPGMPVVVAGTNMAAVFTDCVSSRLPLACGGVSAQVSGRPVPVRSSSLSQVIAYVPVDMQPGQATLTIRNHLGNTSSPFPFTVQQYAPGLSKLNDFGIGRTIGFFEGPGQRAISSANPAVPGGTLTAYAVGLGPTNPVIATGEIGSAATTSTPRLWVDSKVAPVLSAGLGCGIMCEPGNYLVTFSLPPDTPAGDHNVYLEIGGLRSNTVILVVGTPAGLPVVGFLQRFFDASGKTFSPGILAFVGGGGFITGGPIGPCAVDPAVWPLACSGVTVLVNGRPAALQVVMPNSILMQIPVDAVPGPATLVVERSSGGQTVRSAPFNFTLDPVAPALAGQGGSSPYAAANPGSGPGNPAVAGDQISIQAIGLGQTNPPLVTGFPPVTPAFTLLKPALLIGGVPCEDVSAVVFPGAMGIYQVTGRVPKGLPDRDLPLVLEIGGKRSQSGLLVAVTSKPVILAIVNAASNMPGLVSGSWVSIYGRNLAATRREWTEDDIIYDWLPTSLDGAIVAINGTPAVMSYVSPFQVNVLAPDDLPLGPVEVTIQSSQGWQRADAVVKKYAPGFFPLLAPPGNYIIALHTDWSLVYRPGAPPPFPPGTPAKPGETIIFYGTGFGPTTPAVTTQKRFSGSAPLATVDALTVQIGGRTARVAYAGLVGNGLYQINAVVPELPDGDHEVVAVIGGEASLRGRLIPVQR